MTNPFLFTRRYPQKVLMTDSGEEEKNNLLNNKGSILFGGCANSLY